MGNSNEYVDVNEARAEVNAIYLFYRQNLHCQCYKLAPFRLGSSDRAKCYP